MTNTRWPALSGFAAVVLFAVAAGVGISDVSGKSDEELVSWWSDSGNRTRVWIGAALLALAVVTFIVYASGLRETLRRAAGEPLAALGFGSSLVFAGLVLVSAAVQLSIPAAIDFGDHFTLDPDTARLLDPLTYLPLFGGAMVLSLTVGATAAAARLSGVFPRWLARSGYVVAPAQLLNVVLWGIPLAVFGIWVIVTSALMLRDGDPVARAAPVSA
jgi:hypothetical protein